MKHITILFLLILGAANLTQAQWGNDIRLTNDPAVSAASVSRTGGITANGDSIHVVWFDERDGNQEIYYKRSIDGGLSWSADTRLTTNDSVSRQPTVAISDSNVHIVWDDTRDGNHEIYYKQSTDGGASWGADVRLTNDSLWSGHPGLAVSGSDVYVVWRESRDGNTEIYFKHSTDGGIIWGNDIRITNDNAMSFNPSVTVSGSNIHIIWEDRRDGANGEIYYKHSTDGGLNWGTDTRLTNNSSTSNLPTSALSGSDLYVVWNDSRDGNFEIYFKHSADAGLTWGADTRLTNAAGNSWWATVAASASGVHIAWHDDRNGNAEIFYMYSLDEGLSWSSDTLLVNNSATMSERPSIALSGSAVHLNWQDKRDGPNGEIYYKRNPTGNFIGIEDRDITKNYLAIYPNPFSEYTNIEFEMASPGNVEIIIFNQLGNQIQTLKYNNCKAGMNTLQWNCSDKNGIAVPSGIYYCEVIFGKEMLVKKMIVVK